MFLVALVCVLVVVCICLQVCCVIDGIFFWPKDTPAKIKD